MEGLFAFVDLSFGCISGNCIFSIIARFSVPCTSKGTFPCHYLSESLGVLVLLAALIYDELEISRNKINSNVCQSCVLKRLVLNIFMFLFQASCHMCDYTIY